MFLAKELVDYKYQECVDYLNENYEYCYLDSMHYLNEQQEATAIITGLSYGLNGIDAQALNTPPRAINLSMHSQDLYYDFLHAKRAILNGKGKFKKCFITMGYYSLFYDLSLSRSKYKCFKIYMPLFRDSHHALSTDVDYLSNLGEKTSNKLFARSFFLQSPSFYGAAVQREWIAAASNWQQLSPQQKAESAFSLTCKHNKHILHPKTLKDNILIMNQYISFLEHHDIQPIVLVLPFTKEYMTFIRKEYKEILLHSLELLPYRIDFLDMNDLDIFDKEDFVDADHLSDCGALKATHIINDIFL